MHAVRRFFGAIIAGILLARGTPAADPAAAAAAATAAEATAQPLAALPYTAGLDPAAMDRSADACVDFYAYACGGWRARNPIPADEASWSVYGKMIQDNQRFLWGILQQLADSPSGRTPSQQKLGDYFAACMDESALAQRDDAPLAPQLARIAALRSKQDLAQLLAAAHLSTRDPGYFFGFDSGQDYDDSAQVIAFATAGGLGLPDRDYYTDSDGSAQALRQQYREHVARLFTLLGDPARTAARRAAVVLRIETQLARAALTAVDKRDPHKLDHPVDAQALQRLTPKFAWASYLAALGLSGQNRFNVSEPEFFRALNRVLTRTSLDDLKTYLRWHAVHAAAPFLSARFQQAHFDFYGRVLEGLQAPPPRWKQCVRQTDALLGEALGQEFVTRVFTADTKAAALRMVRQIEAAMREDIRGLAWMSPATKAQALAKLDAIVNKVGYPERWRDYAALAITRDDFYGNVVRATTFESQRQLAKIGRPLDRSEWTMTASAVNAYFDPQMNDINFPAGILQPPLFDPQMDDAPNYGNTGGTIGHELTHAFDDEGRQYDAAGNLKNWWTETDAAAFTERAQCVVDQYAQYVVVDEIHLNSRLTLGEDLADLGGLILAHMAWRARTAGQTLPDRAGLSAAQRFFVGYAQWACSNERPEFLRLMSKTDPHSPGRYRVNGVVANLPQFQAAFACSNGQPMAPAKRCRVW